MRYEARMTNVDGIGRPSVIALDVTNRPAAITQFNQLVRAHGDESVLKLSLHEIDGKNEIEIPVPRKAAKK